MWSSRDLELKQSFRIAPVPQEVVLYRLHHVPRPSFMNVGEAVITVSKKDCENRGSRNMNAKRSHECEPKSRFQR